MIINLTPHAVAILSEDGSTTTIPPSGTVARVATQSIPDGECDGIPRMVRSTGCQSLSPAAWLRRLPPGEPMCSPQTRGRRAPSGGLTVRLWPSGGCNGSDHLTA